ncbi:hypothetical protein EU546_03230, partial [Candidatus Thorarchaeota archaeon]
MIVLSSLVAGAFNPTEWGISVSSNRSNVPSPVHEVSQEIQNGTNVEWESYSESFTDEWEYDTRNWIYGPVPQFSVFHENGTEVTQDRHVELQQWTRISATINRTIFVDESDLGNVTVMGIYQTASQEFEAMFEAGFNRFGSDRWWVHSQQFNFSETGTLPPFVGIDAVSCENTSDESAYSFDFWLNLTQDTPVGLYELQLKVFDDSGLLTGIYPFESGWEFNGVAIGLPVQDAWDASFGGSYTFHKFDLDGNTIYSLSRDQNFVTRFNVSGPTPSIVSLGILVPEWLSKKVNKTDHHPIIVNETGGWVYNETEGVYIYSPDAPVMFSDETYGVFESEEELYRPAKDEIMTYRLQWNPVTEEWEVISELQEKPQRLFLIYNTSSDSFEVRFGYSYDGIPTDYYVPGVRNHWTSVYYPMPEDVPDIFKLNQSLCSHYTVGNEEVFEIGGYFTELHPTSALTTHFGFDTQVWGPQGKPYYPDTYSATARQTKEDYTMEKQYSIESPVVSAELLTETGDEPMGYFFHADKGEPFSVNAHMQGGGEILADIDSAVLTLRSEREFWRTDEEIRTVYNFRVRMNMEGTPSFTAFNKTMKRNYTYGSYMDWSLEEVEGWHYVYNATSGDYELEYGLYNDWVYVEKVGWHWQKWFFNQLTQKWQKKEVRAISPQTGVTLDFASAYDFTYWIEESDLHLSFLVEPKEPIPDGSYTWSVTFSKNEWYIDYEAGIGYHELTTWDEDWVYGFTHGPNELIMEPFVSGQLAFYNDTLCANGGVEYLIGSERPYITLMGEEIPLKVKESYRSGSPTTTFFYYDPEDPEAESDYFYELTNGTRIYVKYEDSVGVYNVTLGNDEWFLGGSYNPTWWKDMYSFMDVSGTFHQGTSEPIYTDVTYELVERFVIDEADLMYYIRYADEGVLNITGYWTWDSRTNSWFMVDTQGQPYSVDYNATDGWNYAEVNGTYQRISWPMPYFLVDYGGEEAIISPPILSTFWYHEREGIRYEMPYPGANAEMDSDLAQTVTNNGKVPTTNTLEYLGDVYPAYNISDSWFVDIDTTTYSLEKYSLLYSRVNDTEVWEPATAHYTVYAGTYDDEITFDLIDVAPVDTSGPHYSFAEDLNYFKLLNGSSWIVNQTTVFAVKEYDYYGKRFYSLYDKPVDQSNGTHDWEAYPALNGTLYNITGWAPFTVLSTHLVYRFENASGYFYEFMGETYEYESNAGYIRPCYRVHNATFTGDLFLTYGAEPVYQFDYHLETVNATKAPQYVYRRRTVWGYPLSYGPRPVAYSTHLNFLEMIVGIPGFGLWGVAKWDVNPENGALDIDGDLTTTDDQYYVVEEYSSANEFIHESTGMNVHILWEPNTTLMDDEMMIHSYLGLDEFTWRYEWNQSYYWYHADDLTMLSAAEIQQINATFFTPEGFRRPGYWDISHLIKNVTWEEVLAEAQERGWDWVSTNEEHWVWLSFGVIEEYGTSYMSGESLEVLDIEMRYEYSGLMVWEDYNDNSIMDVNVEDPGSGELTHYLMPRSVDDVSFIRPGQAYGWENESGHMVLSLTDEVTWGVSYHGINGTLIPFTLRGYFGWYDEVPVGTDAQTFEERPSDVFIDDLSFVVHFEGTQNMTEGSLNNLADVKVDNYVGNWEVELVGGRENLDNKSLALNYFAEIGITEYSFLANGTETDQESTAASDEFEIESAGSKFAEMIMGGTTYDWSKNTTAPYNVTSHTTPHKTFRIAYESDSGRTATSWNITTKMFYVSIGFPEWEGYSVFQDPVFVGYVSNRGTGPTDPVAFGPLSISPEIPEPDQEVTVEVDISSAVEYTYAEVIYWTDPSDKNAVGMTEEPDGHFVGTLPGFLEGEQVFYQVVLHTAVGDFFSDVNSYI